jgi:hypothetical protein
MCASVENPVKMVMEVTQTDGIKRQIPIAEFHVTWIGEKDDTSGDAIEHFFTSGRWTSFVIRLEE